MMTTTTPSIALTNAHGLFTAHPMVLSRAMAATRHRSDALIRHQAALCCGFPDYNWLEGEKGALDDCSRIETLIIWIDSGNHTF